MDRHSPALKPKWIIYLVIALLAVLAVLSRFFDEEGNPRSFGREGITDSLVVGTYPDLYEAIYARDAARIAGYLDHASEAVRHQAWRALASTPIDSIKPYLDRALRTDAGPAWMAVSLHALSAALLDTVHVRWRTDAGKRSGLSLVLGRQGNERSLQLLLDHLPEAAGAGYEYEYALAVGRLMTRHTAPSQMHGKLFEQAFASGNPEIIRAYLYGYYRGERQELTSAQKNELYGYWKDFGMGQSAPVDQYVARMLKGSVLYELTLYYNSEKLLDQKIQVAVELAQLLDEVTLDNRNTLAARILMMHENPVVAQQAFSSLDEALVGERKSSHSDLINFMRNEILPDTNLTDIVWLQALDMMSDIDTETVVDYKGRLDKLAGANPYLLQQVLRVQAAVESTPAHIDRIGGILQEGEPLTAMFAIQHLQQYWSDLSRQEQIQIREQVRALVFEGLEMSDRGIAYAVSSLLGDSTLVESTDYRRIADALASFNLPGDIEVYQSMGAVLKKRFPKQAPPLIDSLASLGHVPLNRSLREAGWEVPIPEESGTTFRKPDWERLWEMGRDPVWVLQTGKGRIRIQMHTLRAPATVSAIDSLTRADAYDGVPFHRVVPNFVIQGGDIERSDGFGGPDFVIPTEASELEFERGAAGIASAGTDTEGSQYFFMHQWKPHLNGKYTLFGNVIDGMDVVDRIVVGDRILKAYWE